MKTIITIIVSMSTLLMISSRTPNVREALPGLFQINETGLYPESFIYSSREDCIYIGSYHKGKVIRMKMNGETEDFICDDSLVSVLGLSIDHQRNWLIVCNADNGLSIRSKRKNIDRLASVIIYDLSSGLKIRSVNLSHLSDGPRLLNGVTSDQNGNIFVTDSYAPVIYRIDEEGIPSVLISDEKFKAPRGAFGLSGIVYHPDHFLLVGQAFDALLFRIPIRNPSDFQQIKLDRPVHSIDGLLLQKKNRLILVSNNFSGDPFNESIYQIQTRDHWQSASVIDSFASFAGRFPTSVSNIRTKSMSIILTCPTSLTPERKVLMNFRFKKFCSVKAKNKAPMGREKSFRSIY